MGEKSEMGGKDQREEGKSRMYIRKVGQKRGEMEILRSF